jgi:hypothetical protein
MVLNKRITIMVIDKNLNATKGIDMIEKVLASDMVTLPEGKTIKDFGGGYVEVLKTKAKVTLYFGFTSANNRVSTSFEIKKKDILIWLEALAEKLWNTESSETALDIDTLMDINTSEGKSVNDTPWAENKAKCHEHIMSALNNK